MSLLRKLESARADGARSHGPAIETHAHRMHQRAAKNVHPASKPKMRNEPIFKVQPAQNATACTLHQTNPIRVGRASWPAFPPRRSQRCGTNPIPFPDTHKLMADG